MYLDWASVSSEKIHQGTLGYNKHRKRQHSTARKTDQEMHGTWKVSVSSVSVSKLMWYDLAVVPGLTVTTLFNAGCDVTKTLYAGSFSQTVQPETRTRTVSCVTDMQFIYTIDWSLLRCQYCQHNNKEKLHNLQVAWNKSKMNRKCMQIMPYKWDDTNQNTNLMTWDMYDFLSQKLSWMSNTITQ